MATMREFMQKRKEAKAAMPESQPEPTPTPPGKKKSPPVEAEPRLIITQVCGHKLSVLHLQQSKCVGCQRAARLAKSEKRERRLDKQESQKRLPDGSKFDFVYSAESQTWKGILSIGDGPVFCAEASAVMKLPPLLDRMYRDWLAQQQQGEQSCGTT